VLPADLKATSLLECVQQPGDVIYLPAGAWHATYSERGDGATGGADNNAPPLVVSVGGMGDSTPAIGQVVLGNYAGLQSLLITDPDALHRLNSLGEAAIHHAPNAAVFQWLVEHGADILQRDRKGQGIVHLAAMRDAVWLLEAVCGTSNRAGVGVGAVGAADGIADGAAALQAAAVRGCVNTRATSTGQQPIHFGTSGRATTTMQWLVAHGADVNAQSMDGQTPVHLAAYVGDVALLDWLFGHGGDLHAARTSDGANAAHFAAANGANDQRIAVFDWLAAHGVVMDLPTTTQQQGQGQQRPADLAAALNSVTVVKWFALHAKKDAASPNRRSEL
jgi:ankyrin repeat protein